MKVKDIKELSLPELEKSIRDTRDQLLELKLRKQTGQVENTAELTQRRRDIARMETIRSEKIQAESKSA
ncbi:MAG: 50S ribosomal protein L29 [Verrucomicrobia bacterium TMED71]|jgi:large subunit ribosomal protein L29|uniref:50S ribosomal protein L29 n=1 Tax=Candidatus Pelagisphaera phototrophica TaxID=2684113 RepID=UPI000B664151|nr:50S ribosomal protein L29 [Candidatus Pelagisphaera phototrophica]QXD31920.1 50S ribosomal protein L29 [Candidatus Pelagisphaera phototrophica]RPF82477.1 MAG: 50S ribosomal protein L29 [Verrucomicrobia bacterium TMED71]|tara:strand:- start:1955 stop:2161 length:207 start_codon:yes stop_codon:yes gene_type:complete